MCRQVTTRGVPAEQAGRNSDAKPDAFKADRTSLSAYRLVPRRTEKRAGSISCARAPPRVPDPSIQNVQALLRRD